MSAYAHQMEREYSARSLSSRGDSGGEVGSHYVEESGFYMTSFAATIFIGALVTFGVLLFTLLITLAVMLQSCQSRSKGIVEIQKSSNHLSHCKIFELHAELNSLEAYELPPVCRSLAIEYIREGQYARDLNFTMWMIESYFHSLMPLHGGPDVVLMDIDDIFSPDPHINRLMNRFDQYGCNGCIEEAKQMKHLLTLQLYIRLRSRGWPLILLSRKPERVRNSTAEHLISAGYSGWFSLIMRSDDEMQMVTNEYFSRRRAVLQKEGLNIIGVISSRMDFFTGSNLGKHVFKLPSPIYYKLENEIETWRLSE
ncbi:hypothetical protein SLA2020_061650 [Shorea laevis]